MSDMLQLVAFLNSWLSKKRQVVLYETRQAEAYRTFFAVLYSNGIREPPYLRYKTRMTFSFSKESLD